MLPQVLASGLSAGSIYALMALALVITYKTTEVPNFAQGDMAMVSAFVAYTLLTDFQTGFLVAFTVGLATRTWLKIAALILGSFCLGVFLLSYKEVLSVNWSFLFQPDSALQMRWKLRFKSPWRLNSHMKPE